MIPAANAANKVVRKKKTIAPNRPRMLCTLLICPEVIEFRFLARHGWHCHEQSPSFARSSSISPAGCLWAAGGSVVGDRKSVVEGKRVSVRVDLGGRRIIRKKNTRKNKI